MRTAQQVSLGRCSTSYGAPLPPRARCLPGPRRPAPACASAAPTGESVDASLDLEERPLVVVKSVPPARAPAPPPQPVPIEHSSAFLIRTRRDQADGSSSEAAPSRRPQAAAEAFNGNAVKWALKKADESLDEIEENPPAVVEALYDISRGPVGTAASKGVTTVAKVTWQVGTEAFKAAAPVGKWALQQSFKLAVTAVAKGIESAASSGKEKGSKKK